MEKIEKLLIDCGASVSRLGFGYIIEAYKIAKKNPVSMSAIYAEIADRHGKSIQSVERNIRSIIEEIYSSDSQKPDYLSNGLGYGAGKLTNKEFVFRLAMYFDRGEADDRE